MSRKSSLLEDLVVVGSKLPWWLGLLLATASYAGLHWYAGTPVPASNDPKKMFDVVGPTMWRTLAMIGQYVFPAGLVAGALVSAWKTHKRKGLATDVAADPTTSTLNQMNWREFEQVAGEAFRQRGYKVTERGGSGPDGGVDLVLRKGSETIVVQCKQYRATQVGVAVVRELFGAMTAEGASGGIVVSLGKFTRDAHAFAGGRNIELITGPALHSLLRDGQRAPAATVAKAPSVEARRISPAHIASPAPTCPRCNASMLERIARTGGNQGKRFWGCSKFPECRGTREIANS